MFYLGSGTEFKKSECKKYKTLDRALKAAAKDEELVVWNEDGQCVDSLTDIKNSSDNEKMESTLTNEISEKQEVIVPKEKMKVTVICEGSLNLRRSAELKKENICGRATRGQSYYVKEIYNVNGKKMVRTIDDLYLSGESEYVQFEQL